MIQHQQLILMQSKVDAKMEMTRQHPQQAPLASFIKKKKRDLLSASKDRYHHHRSVCHHCGRQIRRQEQNAMTSHLKMVPMVRLLLICLAS